MPLLHGDIRFARAANMVDLPEGGGPPSAQLLTSGRSNEIFPDLSEETRTVGRTEIYQIFGVLRNADRAALTGSNVILAEPPSDPNVSITLLTLNNPFATRSDVVKRIESGMSPGSEWSGYLLENHYQTMRSITLLQRPGMSPPIIGRTYLLILNEGQAGERRQRVRIKTTETSVRVFSEIFNNQLIDFEAQVTTCELFDGLQFDFPGSPATRTFARLPTKTMVRETVYSDSGMFYSASRLVSPTLPNDVWLRVASIYTQVVPNSRTESATVDQRPTARQTMVLATAPRRIEVGLTQHTKRIKIAEENVGLVFVDQLPSLPEPGLLFIDYWSLGTRYTIYDDGSGRLTGAGGGAVNALTGALTYTLKALPDLGSSITTTWGSRVGYTDRTGNGVSVSPPEVTFVLESESQFDQALPGSITWTWTSGGVVRSATDDGAGKIVGDATGLIDYTSKTGILRPKYMPDPGAQIQAAFTVDSIVTEVFSGVSQTTPDAGGFINLTLAQQPIAGSLSVSWATVHPIPYVGVAQPSPVAQPSLPVQIGSDVVLHTVPNTNTNVTTVPYGAGWFNPAFTEPTGITFARAD